MIKSPLILIAMVCYLCAFILHCATSNRVDYSPARIRIEFTRQWLVSYDKIPKDSTELRTRTLDSIEIYISQTGKLINDLK